MPGRDKYAMQPGREKVLGDTMTYFSPPEDVEHILSRLTENGRAAYLVGGCVRDAVMGRDVHDWDVATSAAPQDVAMMFPKTVLTGERFGTVTVIADGAPVEVTSFRVEGEYKDGRRPDSVEFVDNLDKDLGRRDFTINAMAMSAARDLIDPYGGIRDIKNRLIRCVGDPDARFSEDALRMFRAFRFRAVLGFGIEKGTLRAIWANAGKASLISAERVRAELEKTLMSEKPETVGEMIGAGLLARYITMTRNGLEGLWTIKRLPPEPAMRWCALCAFLLEAGHISSATEFLQNMRLDAKTVRTCKRALSISQGTSLRPGQPPGFPGDSTEIKRLLLENGEDATRCAAAVHDILSTKQGAGSCPGYRPAPAASPAHSPPACFPALARTDEIIASGECYSMDKLAVSGRDLIELGYAPGHELGAMLGKLLLHVTGCPGDNERGTLLKLAKEHKRPNAGD